jgi:hypothetical protein
MRKLSYHGGECAAALVLQSRNSAAENMVEEVGSGGQSVKSPVMILYITKMYAIT